MLLLMLNQDAVDYAVESLRALVPEPTKERQHLEASALVTGLEVPERRADEPFGAIVDILLRFTTDPKDHEYVATALTQPRTASALRTHTVRGLAQFEPSFHLRRMRCSVNDKTTVDITDSEEPPNA